MSAPKWREEGLHTGMELGYGNLEPKGVRMACLSETNWHQVSKPELDKEGFQMEWDGGRSRA